MSAQETSRVLGARARTDKNVLALQPAQLDGLDDDQRESGNGSGEPRGQEQLISQIRPHPAHVLLVLVRNR